MLTWTSGTSAPDSSTIVPRSVVKSDTWAPTGEIGNPNRRLKTARYRKKPFGGWFCFAKCHITFIRSKPPAWRETIRERNFFRAAVHGRLIGAQVAEVGRYTSGAVKPV